MVQVKYISLLFAVLTSSLCRAGELKVGEFSRIYDPSAAEPNKWYINDHCFIRDGNGIWHLFGITHQEPALPMDEDNFAHATAKCLTKKGWKKEPFALSVDPNRGEEHLWAPHVIYDNGLYYMFYCAGAKNHSKYKIHLATSKDLYSWQRYAGNPVVVDGYDARDPFILRQTDKWVMYFTATSTPSGGNHIVASRTSTDLLHWDDKTVVFVDPSKGTWGGPTESPNVVRRGRFYYLFIGPRDDYRCTAVYRSTDPFQWTPENEVARINSHAAEVVRDVDGKWFVSHCGWGQGGVYLAPLEWNDGVNDNDTSMPVPSASVTR
jgi:beta-fructofuranosidase